MKYLADPDCTTCIPLTYLTEDAQGRCYRRVGGDLNRRAHPKRSRMLPRASDEARKRLEQAFSKLASVSVKKDAHDVLKST